MAIPVAQRTENVEPNQPETLGGGLLVGLGSAPRTKGLEQVYPVGGRRFSSESPIHFTDPVSGANTGGDFDYYNNYETKVQEDMIEGDSYDIDNSVGDFLNQIMNVEGDSNIVNKIGDIINIDNSEGDTKLYKTLKNIYNYLDEGDHSLKEILEVFFGDTNIDDDILQNLKTWMNNNGYDNIYDVFIALSGGGETTVHSAVVQESAPSGQYINCNIDGGPVGQDVICSIIGGGTALDEAVPRLDTGDVIYVVNYEDGDGWTCINLFQTSEDCDCWDASA